MSVVNLNAHVGNANLDVSAISALRCKVGRRAFDQFYEDALCDVVERLSRIEKGIETERADTIGERALALSVIAARLGLLSISSVAGSLHDCAVANDRAAMGAVAARLSRISQGCMMAAAEVSVDINGASG